MPRRGVVMGQDGRGGGVDDLLRTRVLDIVPRCAGSSPPLIMRHLDLPSLGAYPSELFVSLALCWV